MKRIYSDCHHPSLLHHWDQSLLAHPLSCRLTDPSDTPTITNRFRPEMSFNGHCQKHLRSLASTSLCDVLDIDDDEDF